MLISCSNRNTRVNHWIRGDNPQVCDSGRLMGIGHITCETRFPARTVARGYTWLSREWRDDTMKLLLKEGAYIEQKNGKQGDEDTNSSTAASSFLHPSTLCFLLPGNGRKTGWSCLLRNVPMSTLHESKNRGSKALRLSQAAYLAAVELWSWLCSDLMDCSVLRLVEIRKLFQQ